MIVTDNHIAKLLADQRVEVSDVEFWHDYGHRGLGKGHNPYAKFYRNTKTDTRIMVVSGLPMVNADGVKICGDNHNETKVGWKLSNGIYRTKPNIFSGAIDGRGVELVALNDQPTGSNKGDAVSWEPRLFLNGVEQHCGNPIWLDVDPINENYRFNVLEWDYGICKRRIRIIEGRFSELWIFPTDPQGEVRITHNFSGNLPVKLGEYAINADEELIPAEVFAKAEYPLGIRASSTFYPDEHIETTSVDGYARHLDAAGLIWADMVGAAGTSAASALWTDFVGWVWRTDANTDKFDYLYRGIMLFDTSGLDDTAIISATTLSLYYHSSADDGSWTPDGNIYSSNPASNDDLVAGDYALLGSTAFCDTPVAYGDWSGTYIDFLLNASGRAAISKTGVSKFGFRNANYDVAEELDPGNHAPTWVQALDDAKMYAYPAEQGNGYKPKLVVTYTLAPTPVTDGDLIGIGVIRKS